MNFLDFIRLITTTIINEIELLQYYKAVNTKKHGSLWSKGYVLTVMLVVE